MLGNEAKTITPLKVRSGYRHQQCMEMNYGI